MSIARLLISLIDFYELLIIVYVLMSWFRPGSGIVFDVHRTLGTIVEPWLGIFRRIVPTVGMVDFSPLVAIIALQLISSLLIRLLG